MPNTLTSLKVFIASPGGLAEERKAFRDAVQELNDADAVARGVFFQPVGWEDTLGGIGRPQTLINEDVRAADYFVLLLWNRWGSPSGTTPSRFSSGTEEEYHVAMECIAGKTMRQIVIFFKSVDPQQLSDPGEQLRKVLEFRKDIEQRKTHLFQSFDTTDSFRRLIRRHLAQWLRNEEKGVTEPPPANEPPIVTDGQDAQTSPALAQAWKLADEGRFTEAEVEFARSIVGRRNPRSLIEYGRFLVRLGRLDQATVMFEGAVAVAGDQGNQGAVADANRDLGIVLRIRGDLTGAEQMHRKALEIDEHLGRLAEMAANYGNLGMVLNVRGDLAGAEEMHRKALEIDERLANLEGMANHYRNLGNVLRVRDDLDGAEQMYRKALEIEERLGRVEGMARNYGNLGIVLTERDDLNGAEQMHRKALEINERLGRLEGMANNYGNLGHLLELRGDLDDAEQMLRKAHEINERLGRLEGMASNYGNRGSVMQARGDLEGAEQMHRKALEINERLGRLEGIANNYINLGMISQARGDRDGAEQMYRKSLEAAERLGSNVMIAKANRSLASLRASS